MTAFIYRCLFSLANFFGLFCFKKSQSGYKISKFQIFSNILKAIVPQSVFCYICFNTSVQRYIYGSDLITMTDYSGFSLIIFGIQFLLEQFIGFILLALHFLKRKEILLFFDQVTKNEIDRKFEKKLKFKIKICLIFAMTFAFASNFLVIITSIELTLDRVLIFILYSFPYYIYFSFIVFIKVSEIYIEILLKNLISDFKYALETQQNRKIQKVSARYFQIAKMIETFHSIFGVSLNVEFCYLALKTTADVRIKLFNSFHQK